MLGTVGLWAMLGVALADPGDVQAPPPPASPTPSTEDAARAEVQRAARLYAEGDPAQARTVLQAAGHLERLRQIIGRHRLTGTLNEPVYRFELSTQEVFKQLAPTPGDLLQNLLDAVR